MNNKKRKTELDQKATKIFFKIISYLKDKNYVKIDNSDVFMPLVVERIKKVGDYLEIYSLAHYGEQNGDLMADPEMEFYVLEGKFVMPGTFINHYTGTYDIAITFDENKERFIIDSLKLHDLIEFANTWMKNIEKQQEL